MPQSTEVLKLPKPDRSTVEKLRTHLASSGYTLRETRDAAVAASGPGSVVTLYETGRLVVQGAEAPGAMAAIQRALGRAPVAPPPRVSAPGAPAKAPRVAAPPKEDDEGEPTDGRLATVTIYTDGACLGNPGPGGYGAVMINGAKRKELSGGYRLTTNNRMEIMGCLAALEALKKPCQVTLYSDSQYVVNAISKGWAKHWKAKGWVRSTGERAINPDLWERLLELCRVNQVEFRWVRGHNGDPNNERCDQLAVTASRAPGLPLDPGYKPSK